MCAQSYLRPRMRPSLDIILPIYQPSDDWFEQLILADAYWAREMSDVTICYLIVDDGSASPQSEKAQARWAQLTASVRYLRYENNGGKGKAVRHGALHSEADILIYTDHDLPYEMKHIPEFYGAVTDGNADLVLCHRDEKYFSMTPPARRAISSVLKTLIKTFVRIPTTDTQGGLKALSPAARDLLRQLKTDSYLFDLELVKDVHKAGLKITSLPVELRENLEFSSMPASLLLKEFRAFLRILVK